MASGGIASPTDPLEGCQYTTEELGAAVDEARRFGTYVLAHSYSDESVLRCVQAGIRSIEHGSLISDRAARLMADRGTFLVPTLSPYHWVADRGRELGLPQSHLDKAVRPLEGSREALAIAARHGVKMALGSDLFRTPKEMQAYELVLRAEILPVADVLRSATIVGAELVGMAGEIGEVLPGMWADLLVVNGDPLSDLGVLQDQGAHIPLIMKAGVVVKDELTNPTNAVG